MGVDGDGCVSFYDYMKAPIRSKDELNKDDEKEGR